MKFDVYEEFRKMSFRNRCVVAGGAGPVNLSIPLVGGRNQRKPMREVEIDNRPDWQGQHWKTITSCYNRSPWFEFYKHELEEIYNQPVEFLVDWNKRCWNWVMEKLDVGVKTEYGEGPVMGGARMTEDEGSTNSKLESGARMMEDGGSTTSNFESGAGRMEDGGSTNSKLDSGARMMEDGRSTNSKLESGAPRAQGEAGAVSVPGAQQEFLDWRNKLMPKSIARDFPEAVRYRQVFEDRIGFLPHLSILDLLFCEGRRTVEILKSSKIPI